MRVLAIKVIYGAREGKCLTQVNLKFKKNYTIRPLIIVCFYFQFGLSTWNSEKRHKGRKCCSWTFVFDPSGRLVYYWSFIVSLAFLYNFWVSIYEHEKIRNPNQIQISFSGDHLQNII